MQAVLREYEGEDPLVSTILNERRKLAVTSNASTVHLDADTCEQLKKNTIPSIASWGTEPLTPEHKELIEEMTNLLKVYEFQSIFLCNMKTFASIQRITYEIFTLHVLLTIGTNNSQNKTKNLRKKL